MYRLNAVTIDLPPLRDRKMDISLLAEHFARQVNKKLSFSRNAMEMLENYDWPGNIRELENAVLHSASLCDDLVEPEHLPARVRSNDAASTVTKDLQTDLTSDNVRKLTTLAECEEEYVMQVLQHTGGNKQAASRIRDIEFSFETRS